MTEAKPNIEAIMAEIKDKVRAEIAENGMQKLRFNPKQADGSGQEYKAGGLLSSDSLRYLNDNHAMPDTPDLAKITSHRGGITGKAIVKVKRIALTFIWKLLKQYFEADEGFRLNLVRHLNYAGAYVDARDAENFWELIRKIDYDVNKALKSIEDIATSQTGNLLNTEKRVMSELQSYVQNLEKGLTELKAQSERDGQQLKTLDSVCRGLEGLVAKFSKVGSANNDIAFPEVQPQIADSAYLLLENRFRGSEDEIKKRQSFYVEYFKEAKAPVLDVGCGRGELLELFQENSIEAFGIDIDQAMIQHCKEKYSEEKQLTVKRADAISFLQQAETGSLGGLIALQVVEHLQREYLETFLALCKAKLAPGSKVIFETINPQSVLALSSNYFRDPTHVFPQHPDTLRYQMELSGLKVEEVKYLSPVEGVLQKIPSDEQMPPRWQTTVSYLNQNIEQLNQLLYAYMDYAIIGVV